MYYINFIFFIYRNTSLESVDLYRNSLGESAGPKFASWIASGIAPIKYINLKRTEINPRDILLSLRNNTTLTKVKLADNDKFILYDAGIFFIFLLFICFCFVFILFILF